MRQVWLLRTDEKFRFWIHADVGSKPHKRLSAYIGQGKATNTGLHATRHKHEGAYIGGYEGSTVSISLCRCGNGLQNRSSRRRLDHEWMGRVAALGRFHDESHLFSNACISNPLPLFSWKKSSLVFRGLTSIRCAANFQGSWYSSWLNIKPIN